MIDEGQWWRMMHDDATVADDAARDVAPEVFSDVIAVAKGLHMHAPLHPSSTHIAMPRVSKSNFSP
jgi:hypothetical protein